MGWRSYNRVWVGLTAILLGTWFTGCESNDLPPADFDEESSQVDGPEGGDFEGDPPFGYGSGGAQSAPGSCPRPDEGCPCADDAEPVECYGEGIPEGTEILCTQGTRYCRDNRWSGCESVVTFRMPRTSDELSDGPRRTNLCNPNTYLSRDIPNSRDLRPGNHGTVRYDPRKAGLVLPPSTTGTMLADTDRDGVPDLIDDYPRDPRRSGPGFNLTLPRGAPAAGGGVPAEVRIRSADVYFLMDTTYSMSAEIANLKRDLARGTFGTCAAARNTGITGAIKCEVDSVEFGVGYTDDYRAGGYGQDATWHPNVGHADVIYRNLTNLTSHIPTAQAGVNRLNLGAGADGPEGQTQALWAMATGRGLGRYLTAARRCVRGRWGYPCFRDEAVPIVILLTDAPFHNGPQGRYNYNNRVVGINTPTWSQVLRELNRRNMKVMVVNSGGSYGGADHAALATGTGSVDSRGRPYVYPISSNGSGLSAAIATGVKDLAQYNRMDVTMVARDNPATASVDERRFVSSIRAVSFSPAGWCTGIIGGRTFRQCKPGANVVFDARFSNTFVNPTTVPQIFTFDMEIIGDNTTVLKTIPVRILVPPNIQLVEPEGFFKRSYDAHDVCNIPPERVDWGWLSTSTLTPSNSRILFEIRTRRTANFTGAPDFTITRPGWSTWVDIGAELARRGKPTTYPHLEVKARLFSSRDRRETPVLRNFQLRFSCANEE